MLLLALKKVLLRFQLPDNKFPPPAKFAIPPLEWGLCHPLLNPICREHTETKQ